MDVQELWPRTSQMNKPMDSSSHPIHMTLPGRGRASFTRFYSSHCEIKKNEKERRTEKVPWRTINRDRLPTTMLVWGSVPVASDRGAPRAFLSSAGDSDRGCPHARKAPSAPIHSLISSRIPSWDSGRRRRAAEGHDHERWRRHWYGTGSN